MGLKDIYHKWRDERARKAYEKEQLLEDFFAFIEETRPLMPKADKHPDAALYRHAWKRAFVLASIAAP